MGHRTTHLADLLVRTVTGTMWHGPALAELLTDVSRAEAAARPIPGAHSIWELVLHTTVWAGIARDRLKGEKTGDPNPDEDWPSIVVPDSDDEWSAAISRLRDSYRALAADVALLEDHALDEPVRHRDYSVETMLLGVVEHGTYHGGQIALLKRATAPR